MLLDHTLNFLSEFSEILPNFITDKVIIVGDLNIFVEVDNDSLSIVSISLFDLIGFTQSVNKPTHSFTTHPRPCSDFEIQHLLIFPQNPLLSDHYLITFEFL